MLGFRALQAIMDLRAAAGRQSGRVLRGIVDRLPPSDRDRGADGHALARVILRQGCRLEQPVDRALLDALKLAASQPDDDRGAFVCATSVLLADRLQSGLGDDMMGHFWNAFHDVYFALPAVDRAAIVQGYLAGAQIGRLAPVPLPSLAHLTEPEEAVHGALLDCARAGGSDLAAAVDRAAGSTMAPLVGPHLRAVMVGVSPEALDGDSALFEALLEIAADPQAASHIPATALLLAEAVRTRDAEGWFAVTLWQGNIARWLALEPAVGRPLLAGLRFLYEADPGWEPHPARLADPRRMAGYPVLPVLDASYTGSGAGVTAG